MRRWCKLVIAIPIASCSASSDGTHPSRGSSFPGGSPEPGGAGSSSAGVSSVATVNGSSGRGPGTGNIPMDAGTARTSGAAGSASATGAGEPCDMQGKTRQCCVGGTQTCSGLAEFPMWGPCVDASGMTVTSCSKCEPGEFGGTCDAGTPPPPPPPPPPPLCDDPRTNNEPQILAAYAPAAGETVREDGQIKVWVTDELPAFLAENEQIHPMTGAVVTPGDRGGLNIDGYPNEPTLYVTPVPPTLGTGGAFYPQWVKGDYNNQPSLGPDIAKLFDTSTVSKGPAVDPAPQGMATLPETYNSEFIWEVNAMHLTPGTYLAQFVIHDGDLDRAVGCNMITITPGPD